MKDADFEEFRDSLLDYINDFINVLSTPNGDWTVKGFIDIAKNIYTISVDMKVISKILELMLFPIIQQFAQERGIQIDLSEAQNFYPDMTFIFPDGTKAALDVKSTYRVSPTRISGFTLGAFTGYFRFRSSAKNTMYPYQEYAKHYVLGVIYTKQEELIDENRIYTIDDLGEILSVIRDFEIVLREKYQIASDSPGSGNTKNIGSTKNIEELRNGTGVFAAYGIEIFDDYWMHYLTHDMARQAELAAPLYRNLQEYLTYRGMSQNPRVIAEPGQSYVASMQLTLPQTEDQPSFPSTRFQGSKLKIVDWIWDSIKELEFDSALEAFGGTGCVSHYLKRQGKVVFYNDILKFNYYIGLALIENDDVRLSPADIDFLIQKHPGTEYPTFIQDTFHNIYFTDDENQWLDVVVTNVEHLENLYKKALAYFALFQATIAKRPFNLFHRKNLYLRTSDVDRSFGNKATWDTPFPIHFTRYASEANGAVFSNGRENKALNCDTFEIEGDFDLVYIDTPYMSRKGVGVDYMEFYHFLEGLVTYDTWASLIDYRSKHRKLKHAKSPWCDQTRIHEAFDRLFRKFQDSILVVSYRDDGIPSLEELTTMLKRYKKTVKHARTEYKYVLSNSNSHEILLVAV